MTTTITITITIAIAIAIAITILLLHGIEAVMVLTLMILKYGELSVDEWRTSKQRT